MRTRAKSGFRLPQTRLNLHASPTLSPLPKTYKSALLDPNWSAAMRDEFHALQSNNTWQLVPRPPNANVVSGKWVFRQKFHSDGTLSRYKARWVCRGFSQQHGVDYDETFSPVVKPSTIRTILSLAVSSSWPIHQLDVKNAFLHGSLTKSSILNNLPVSKILLFLITFVFSKNLSMASNKHPEPGFNVFLPLFKL
jgi:hypothetical protein